VNSRSPRELRGLIPRFPLSRADLLDLLQDLHTMSGGWGKVDYPQVSSRTSEPGRRPIELRPDTWLTLPCSP